LLTFTLALTAQTKKGIKYLKKEKWEQAVTAFGIDTADAALKPVAQWGLSQALSNPANPNRDYSAALRLQNAAKDAFKSLKSSERTALTKKYDISIGAIDRVRTLAGTNFYKEIEKEGTLDQSISYLDNFPKAPTRNREKITVRKKDQIKKAVTAAKNYEQIRDLTGKYREEVLEDLPASTLEGLDNRLLKAFMDQQGIEKLPEFYRDNPMHPATKDPGAKRFPEVWKNGDAAAGITFLNKYPASAFASYIRTKTLDLLKKKPLTAAERSGMTEDEQGTLAEIELEAAGNLVDTYSAFDESKKDGWLQYVKKLAPSVRAYAAFEKMLKHYMDTRNWKEASAILHAAQPLFPAKKSWFDEVTPIMDAPEEGIATNEVSRSVNEEGSEYIPVPSTDGKTLYFCATNHEDNVGGEDVFVSVKADSGWSKPHVIRELSKSGHQAPLSLSADGNKMLLYDGGKPFQSVRQTDGKWATPVKLDINMDRFSWVGLVQVAANDQVMVFEAYRENTSNKDLFIALRQPDGNWGEIMPLDSLNTDVDDRSPFLHADMKTLYFSSAGRPGLGGMDVFKTQRLDDTWLNWSKPENIGKELNTMADDWSYKISADGQIAWFSTQGRDKKQDIFFAGLPLSARPESVKIVELTLTDDQGKPFTGSVLLENPANGKTEGTFRANPSGGVTVITVPNDKPYNIRLVQPGYFPVSIPVPVTAPGQPLTVKTTIKPVNLDKMVSSGQAVALNLFFDYDKSDLKSESLPELRTVAEVASKNNYKINLKGYTDNAGIPAYNQTLSQQRAEAARQSLIEMGIKPERITASGLGENNPIATNDTDAGRAKNRRVEVQFVK